MSIIDKIILPVRVTNPDGSLVGGEVGLAKDNLPISGATQAVGVGIVDKSGEQIDSFGGGIQYTEGDADASITGTAIMFETNEGTNAVGVVNATNPLPVSASIDTTGLATDATDTNTGVIAGDTTSIDTKTPALGQALAAASVPVVLPAAQVTTLTPPSAITGFATEAKQLPDDHNVTVSNQITQPTTPSDTQPVSAASLPLPTGAATAANQQTDALTDAELRATPVPISGTFSLPTGASTLTEQQTQTALLTTIEANQLPDGHNVTVDNQPTEFPLPTAQVTTLTPPAAITGFATAAKQLPDGHNVTIDNASIPVTGTFWQATQPVSGTVTANTGLTQPLTDTQLRASAVPISGSIDGTVAHDGVDSGNPVKVGMKAISHGANPTTVATNDVTDWYANRAGVPWVIGGHPNIVTVRANYTSAQTNTAIITVGAGVAIVVTRCSAVIANSCIVDVSVRIGLGTSTTPTTTGVILSHPGIAPGSGVIEGNGSGTLGAGASNDDLRITSTVPTGGSLDVVVSYYTIGI
jgi:hypothetical protein